MLTGTEYGQISVSARKKVTPMKADGSTRDRTLDWAESAIVGTLAATMLGASPYVAYVAGRWASGTLARVAQAEKAPLRRVPATLLETAPEHRHGTRETAGTPAQWLGPDGLRRTGPISAPAGALAGSQVRVWITQAGAVVPPPLRQEKIASRVALTQALAAAGFPAGLGAIGWLAMRRLERRRLS